MQNYHFGRARCERSVSSANTERSAPRPARVDGSEAMELVPTSPEGEQSEMTPTTRTGPRRMLFIDNIRWTMILLVLSMHATDTYSPFGNWYYTDRSQRACWAGAARRLALAYPRFSVPPLSTRS